MSLRRREISLPGPRGPVRLKRNKNGIPVVSAGSKFDSAFGLGWVHACDRQLQTLLMRILLRGRAAECLKASEELIAVDRFMRRLDLFPDLVEQMKKLSPDTTAQLSAYADGFNTYLRTHRPVWELRVLGYEPEPWSAADSLFIGKVFTYFGIADIQASQERFLLELIREGLDEPRLRELYPYLCDEIDYDLIGKLTIARPVVPEPVRWLMSLPQSLASNNWAVSGEHTTSGKPLLCGDIHLEINRMPSIWQEIVISLPDNELKGVMIPGFPGLIIGRTSRIAWSPTTSMMDMIDSRIEHCRDGQYRREDGWHAFSVREESIKTKKGDTHTLRVYENEHGILEGDPYEQGYYLVSQWTVRKGCGCDDVEAILALPDAESASEAMGLFKKMDCSSFNWVVCDTAGHIDYQMSGRMLDRPHNVSGLLALPGWERRFDYRGFVDKDDLPAMHDPEEGVFATANNDLNHMGKARPINMPDAPYRVERIYQLLEQRHTSKLSIADMQKFQYDLRSLKAERFMRIIRPLLPGSRNGAILRAWNETYSPESRGATLFESVYLALLRVIFGDYGFGRDVIDHIEHKTGLIIDLGPRFDDILLSENSAWFRQHGRQQLYEKAIEEGLKEKPRRFARTRRIRFAHILFRGSLLAHLGFDYGPAALPGGSGCINVGLLSGSPFGRTAVGPAYRQIADMSSNDLYTNMPGGPSDRRFSRWYSSEFKNWFRGEYKCL